MNYCTTCGNEMPEKAVFCSGCGSKVDGEVQTAKSAPITSQDVKVKVASTLSYAKENIERSGYFNYFKATLLRPSSITAKSEGMKYNGWIHLAVLTLVTTFSFYMIIKGIINVAINQIGFGIGSLFGVDNMLMREMRNAIVPRLIVAGFLVYLVIIATAFFSLKVMTKTKQTFNDTLNQFGGLLTPNIIILTLAGLLSFLFVSETVIAFSTMLIGFSLLLCLASYNFYLYKSAVIKGLDKLYVLLISNLILLLVVSIVVYIQVEPIITALENFNSFSNFRW